MVLEAKIHWLPLLAYVTLFTFSYKTYATDINDTKTSVICSMHTNERVSVNFTVPKKHWIYPDYMRIFYRVKNETTWTRTNMISVKEKEYPDRIQDWVDIKLQPTTRYQVKVAQTSAPFSVEICEFCSQTDKLEPVQELRVHSTGSYWFALAWVMPFRTCPEKVKYKIAYHNNSSPFLALQWTEESGYPLILITGEHYVRITRGVRPNTTYNVTVNVQADELGDGFLSAVNVVDLKTTPSGADPVHLKPEKSPFIVIATNTTLKVSTYQLSACENMCTITWQYKELDDTVWRFAGKNHQEMKITGLNASTVYQVRALLQRYYECEPYDGDDVPILYATTLPVLEPLIPEHSPQVVRATNTSLTMVTDQEEEFRRGYIAHWEYKEPNDTTWIYAGEQYAVREMTISNLIPSKEYEVRFNLQWPTGRRQYSEYSSLQETKTCPSTPEPIPYAWATNRALDSLTVMWPNYGLCDIRYFVRWKECDDCDKYNSNVYPPDSYDDKKCPYNATLVNVTTMQHHECFEPNYYNCYIVNENISPGKHYAIEIVIVDAEGKCSHSHIVNVTSPMRFWGVISFGQWTLIVLGVLLLFAAVPACIILKKRKAACVTTGDVAFTKSSDNGTGSNEEGIGDVDGGISQEPTTRILDRRTESPNS